MKPVLDWKRNLQKAVRKNYWAWYLIIFNLGNGNGVRFNGNNNSGRFNGNNNSGGFNGNSNNRRFNENGKNLLFPT